MFLKKVFFKDFHLSTLRKTLTVISRKLTDMLTFNNNCNTSKRSGIRLKNSSSSCQSTRSFYTHFMPWIHSATTLFPTRTLEFCFFSQP